MTRFEATGGGNGWGGMGILRWLVFFCCYCGCFCYLVLQLAVNHEG